METGTSPPRSRRSEPRMAVVLAVEVSSEGKEARCGVTRNASGKGLLIVTPSRFSVGEQVRVAVHAGTQSSQVTARVVRVEENGQDSSEIWRYRLAVALDGELPGNLLEEVRMRAQ